MGGGCRIKEKRAGISENNGAPAFFMPKILAKNAEKY